MKHYMLFKNSALPSERTLVMSKATRTQIIDFAIKKAQLDGGELPKTINDKQLVKFLKTIDYDLIEIENEEEEAESSTFLEEKFVYETDVYITKIKIGRTNGEDDRPPIKIDFLIDRGMDIEYATTYSDVDPEHEPTDDFVEPVRRLSELVLEIQDHIKPDTLERMTTQGISIKWKNSEHSDNKQLMGITISYLVHHPELLGYSCGNTPFLMFESYLENNDDKTGKIGINRQWETHIRGIFIEAQKYMRGKYKNQQLNILDAIGDE